MHYQNGREAQNGDKIIQYDSTTGTPLAVGTLINATPGNDYCNGSLVVASANGSAFVIGACLVDCLHIEDAEKHPRPAGK